MHDKSLSLAAGAIAGWDRRNAFYFNLINCLAGHYGFDTETPYGKLPKRIRDVLLYGSGSEKIPFTYLRSHGRRPRRRNHSFEGVLPNMERRYKDSESSLIREELSRYMNTQFCETCNGSRLRESARHVFVGEKAIHEITALPVEQSLEFFQQLKLPGRHRDIAAVSYTHLTLPTNREV